MAIGLIAVINATRLLDPLAPDRRGTPGEGHIVRKSSSFLFRSQPGSGFFYARDGADDVGRSGPAIGNLRVGRRLSFAGGHLFATVTVIWIALAVARGAMEPRSEAQILYRGWAFWQRFY